MREWLLYVVLIGAAITAVVAKRAMAEEVPRAMVAHSRDGTITLRLRPGKCVDKEIAELVKPESLELLHPADMFVKGKRIPACWAPADAQLILVVMTIGIGQLPASDFEPEYGS